MKFKLLFCALFCAVSAFAQFNSLRGPAYNPYGTLGAAPTIADLFAKPSDIYGHKFIYVAPIDYVGYSAFDLAGGSAFLGFGNSIILGYAKNSWGLALDWTPNKLWYGHDSYTFDEYRVGDGDNIGLNVSFAFKNFTVYGGTNWLTNKYEYHEYDSTRTSFQSVYLEEESSTRNFVLGVTGGSKLAWDLALDFKRFERMTDQNLYGHDETAQVISNDTLSTIKMRFSLGYKALQSDRARLIVGLNNSFAWNFHERSADYYIYFDYSFHHDERYYELLLNISPNILGEVALSKHLLAFMGADYGLFFHDTDGSLLIISRRYAKSYLGLRYERDNWAVETSLRNVFDEDYDGKNPFINLGGFIYF